MSSQNILITGCNGLIGEVLTGRLKKNNSYNVTGIGRTDKGICKTITIDFDTDWKTEVLPKNIDIIIHLAQSEKFRDFPENSLEVFNVNTVSTLKLLDYARNAAAKKFIYASSGGLYGSGDITFKENSPLTSNRDLGFYLSTKVCSENLVESYRKFFEVNIIRPFFVYGPKQRKDMLIPRLIESVKNGSPIKLQGEEGIIINPIYVDDAARSIEKLISFVGNDTFNIAGDENLSIKDIAEAIGKRFDKKPSFDRDISTNPKNIIADNTKMKQSLEKPVTGFFEALKSFQ